MLSADPPFVSNAPLAGDAASRLEFPICDAALLRLENGLEVIVKEDHSAPLVSVQAWVRTGSIFEGELLGSGVSHLVEHMVFQGAGDRKAGEVAKAVQDTGGYLNAYTSFDRTVYWIDTLVEGLETAVSVLADLTTRATFPEAEFAKEKDVIRREIDMGRDDPGRTVSQLMFSTVFREHPCREPVIGRLEVFNAVDRDTAFAYYQRHYQPGRMFLVVTGAVETEEILALAERYFGPAGNRYAPVASLAEEPLQTGRRDAHIEFSTAVTRMDMAWRIPGLLHPDAPALDVLGALTGSGRASRLYREIRERRGLVHGIGAGAWTPVQGGAFYVSAECEPAGRQAAEDAIVELIETIKRDGVTPAEVARSRRIFLADQLQSLSTMRGQASDIGSNWHTAHNLNFTRDYLAAVDRVTPEEIVRVANRWLIPSGLSSVSINPKGSQAARAATVRARGAAAVQRHVSANGLTLLVREDARLPAVSIHAALRGGLLAETAAANGIGRLMARTIIKGTASRSADEISDLIESGGGSLNAESGGSSFAVSAQVLEPDWRQGVELWADVLLRPVFPEEEIAREKERQVAAIRQEEDHPSFVTFRELRRAAYGEHPLALGRNGTVASVETLTSDAVRTLHQSILTSGNAVLAVFGDVKFEEVREAVEQAFASLPTGPRVEHEAGLVVPPWTPVSRIIPSEKRQAFLAVGYPTVDLRHPDRLALDLLDEACSDMASRFFERIREEHGLAYSVGTTQVLGMAAGLFAFYLSTSPEQLEFARTELRSEISNLATGGLTAEELDRARRTWAGKQAMQRQSNAGLAQQCAIDELYGLGFDHEEQILERVRSLSLEEVNAAASRYFGTVEPIQIAVTPGVAAGEV